MIKTLLAQVKQYKKDSLLAPLFTTLESIMEILLPFVTAMLIDKGISAGDMGQVWKYGIIMIIMAFISLAFGMLAGKYSATASTGFAANLRDSMYEKIQTYSFSNIDKFSTAGLVTRMTTDVTNLQNAYMMLVRIAVKTPVMMITSVIMALLTSVRLSMIFLVAVVVLGIALSIIVSAATKTFNKVFSRYDDLNASVEENVSAARVVKAYVREDYEDQKFGSASDNLKKLFEKAETIVTLNNPMMMLVVNVTIILLSWFGAQFVVGGSLTTGELTSMFSYVMNILMSMMMLSMIFVMLTMSVASARRICAVLNEVPDIQNPENPVTDVKDGQIDFDHVGFSYQKGSGEPVLSDIDLHIKSGETIGIMGPTGSGKSTLVSLISRLYDATDGDVKVGGTDVRNYDLETLRNNVSVVLQNNVLFSGTIYDNLRWGNENASDEECQKACQLACADEFIDRFPDGYNTVIEQGGTNVSGGQKQRLCIARALLKNPKVLILDDSTSAVDTATDAKIREGFSQTIPGTTKLIISQRISTLKDADRILVLDDGRISGFDTPDKLYETNEIYHDICDAQTSGSGDFDAPQAD